MSKLPSWIHCYYNWALFLLFQKHFCHWKILIVFDKKSEVLFVTTERILWFPFRTNGCHLFAHIETLLFKGKILFIENNVRKYIFDNSDSIKNLYIKPKNFNFSKFEEKIFLWMFFKRDSTVDKLLYPNIFASHDAPRRSFIYYYKTRDFNFFFLHCSCSAWNLDKVVWRRSFKNELVNIFDDFFDFYTCLGCTNNTLVALIFESQSIRKMFLQIERFPSLLTLAFQNHLFLVAG